MTEHFFTLTMMEQELGYPPRGLRRALSRRPLPPCAHIGSQAVYSAQQVTWLQKHNDKRPISERLPAAWATPWDDNPQHTYFMSAEDIAKTLGTYRSQVDRMLRQTPLEPDAVAGYYTGYLPQTVAYWIGYYFPHLLSTELLVTINKYPGHDS